MKLITFAALGCLLLASCEKPAAKQEQTQEEPKRTTAPSPILVSDDPEETSAKAIENEVAIEPTVTPEEKPLADSSTDSDDKVAQKCQAQLQQSENMMREMARIYNHAEGASFSTSALKGTSQTSATCPLDGTPYVFKDAIPAEGTPYATCPNHSHDH